MKHSLALLPAALLGFLFPLVAQAQVVSSGEGQVSGPTSSGSSAGYSCDPEKCKLPDCNCASADAPGGLSPEDTPMFIVFTADDAIQSYTLDSVNQFLGQRKNPNGCAPKMTYYTSLNYTNYTLITDWYVAGNEIADHTMTHMADPSQEEINGNLIAMNALAGIPLASIQGFRAPYLNYSVNTLKYLAEAGFTYDSSASACTPVTEDDTDAYWPYTLDNGMANDCLMVEGICQGEPKLPGFWEVPMYCFFDSKGVAGTHLMDPWLDMADGNDKVDNAATLKYLKSTFTDHYNGKRQPIGLYTHPIHLSTTYPGVNADQGMIDMVNEFLDWAQEQQNVWIVSTEQLLAWTRNPTKISDLDSFNDLKCATPDVSDKICNGMPSNEEGLLQHCAFSDSPFYTCYGCPKDIPTVSNPNPEQDVEDGQQERFRLPTNCSTPFWDPINGKCICESDSCAFNDDSRPIGPNGGNLTGGGTGGSNPSESADPYVPFNGEDGALSIGASSAMLLATFGALMGTMAIFARL